MPLQCLVCQLSEIAHHVLTPSVMTWDALVVNVCRIVFKTNGDSGNTNGITLRGCDYILLIPLRDYYLSSQ